MTKLFACALFLAACGDGTKSDADFRADVVTGMHDSITADLSEIIARHSLAKLRKTSFNNHFWKGQPGQWRQLITAGIAGEIAAAHAGYFRRLGYAADADPELADAQADRNWIAAAGPSLREALHAAAASHIRERDALRGERDRLSAALAEERARFVPYQGLQGFSVRVARAVQSVRDRVPKPFRRPTQPR